MFYRAEIKYEKFYLSQVIKKLVTKTAFSIYKKIRPQNNLVPKEQSCSSNEQ